MSESNIINDKRKCQICKDTFFDFLSELKMNVCGVCIRKGYMQVYDEPEEITNNE